MTVSSPPAQKKMAWVATVSAFCELWVFRLSHKPTLPANSAVGVATKTCIIMKASMPNLISSRGVQKDRGLADVNMGGSAALS